MAEWGFTVIDAGIVDEVSKLKDLIAAKYNLKRDYFCYSLMEFSYEQNIEIRAQFGQILTGFYNAHFKNFRSLNESFLIKPAFQKDELLLHQDFCYTEEEQYAAYNIWIPLADVSAENGAITVLPGSQHCFKNYRSSTLPTLRVSMQKFPPEKVKILPMQAGQVLLFNSAVFHGSLPNLTNHDRTIVTATITHEKADYVYYHSPGETGKVKMIGLDDDAYLRDLNRISNREQPNGKLLRQFDLVLDSFTEEKLIHWADKRS